MAMDRIGCAIYSFIDFIFLPGRAAMKSSLLQALAGTVLVLVSPFVWGETAKECNAAGPPAIWIVKSSYPFQAGTEKSLDELYHGPWKTQVDIVLYASPRSQHAVGTVKGGTVVEALYGDSIVVHPLRFVAAHDSRVGIGFNGGSEHIADMKKGDVFWVLNSGGEGEFEIWWYCNVVGWDSTAPPQGNQNRLELLGTNEERWVKVRDPKTGLTGWFKKVPAQDGPKLVPAEATTKSTG